ncbi:hypothetical protein [uncultured Thiocystis sp.]|jgi:hypothetical protein|uniref:hypothetical protein n=1 Tax=uncultured Thiocystis sp. TaxID=1202134 RepID=UPI0025F73DE1|nr:hypothetical protein [uncultured Thiocystis sp.]
MPTALPSGPFLWHAQVTGDLCDCAVDWAWDFVPDAGYADAAPTVIVCGRQVAVLATLSEGATVFDPS